MSVPTASPERLIYLAACKFQDAAAQSDYLDEACGSDRELRKRLERLLQFQSSPESHYLERALTPEMKNPILQQRLLITMLDLSSTTVLAQARWPGELFNAMHEGRVS